MKISMSYCTTMVLMLNEIMLTRGMGNVLRSRLCVFFVFNMQYGL